MARSLKRDANTSCTACLTASRPSIFKNVSCWPANEASGKSSAVADERTATLRFSLPSCMAINACAIASLKAG